MEEKAEQKPPNSSSLYFFLKRLSVLLVTAFAITTITFILMKCAPGDPFQDEKGLSPECLKNLRAFYGLDDPILTQYFRYLKSIFSFNFGPSLKYPGQTVNEILAASFPISFILGLQALLIAICCGTCLGLLSALRQQKPLDTLVTTSAILVISLPSFVIASSLQYLFAISFPLFPIARWGTPLHTILPSIALALGPMATITRLLRASTLEVLNEPYIHTAYVKGLAKRRILFVHVLKNSFLPVLSYLGPVTTNILVGSFVVERIFSIPGLGQWFVSGVMNRDYAIIGSLTLFYSLLLLLIHTFIDFINTKLDPRITLHDTH